MRTSKNNVDKLIDQALMEYPLEPVPADMVNRIMSEIEHSPVVYPFRLSWVDFGLSLILALFIGSFLDVVQGFLRSTYWVARFHISTMLLWRDFLIFVQHNQIILIASLISISIMITLFAILTSVYHRTTAAAANGTT